MKKEHDEVQRYHTSATGEIYYTTDGSDPTEK
ncbi:MAG: chitobiase/beta-hexosaminidase C-terminal domain-containing protein [Coprococcus comes]